MTAHWSLDDIPWDRFDPEKVDPSLLRIVKAAALVEFNGEDYADYLCSVFPDDAQFQEDARLWAVEEVQHGRALAEWAKLADPGWDFDAAVALFRDTFKVDTEADSSIRGSRAGELIARCIVETGTSSYYTALAEASREPVLSAVCRKIAADELRHYKLFYDHLRGYIARDKLSSWQRLSIALGRIGETEDDELSCAYWAANTLGADPYDCREYGRRYLGQATRVYREAHMHRVANMVLKAAGLKAGGWYGGLARRVAWWGMRNKAKSLARWAGA